MNSTESELIVEISALKAQRHEQCAPPEVLMLTLGRFCFCEECVRFFSPQLDEAGKLPPLPWAQEGLDEVANKLRGEILGSMSHRVEVPQIVFEEHF